MLGTLFPSNLSTKVTNLLRKKKEGEVYFRSDLGGKVKSCHEISKSVSHLRFYVYVFRCCQFMIRIVQADFPVSVSRWCIMTPHLRTT